MKLQFICEIIIIYGYVGGRKALIHSARVSPVFCCCLFRRNFETMSMTVMDEKLLALYFLLSPPRRRFAKYKVARLCQQIRNHVFRDPHPTIRCCCGGAAGQRMLLVRSERLRLIFHSTENKFYREIRGFPHSQHNIQRNNGSREG